MAEGAQKELREEASCSVCLDFFRDPVMIPECSHTFCRACLTRSWGDLQGAEVLCPLCRGPAQEGTLRPNQQLANLVEIAKKFTLQEAGVEGGVCEKHQEPLKFLCQENKAPLCLVCGRSQEHRDHQEIPLEEASQEKKAVLAGRKGRVCQKHQEPLKLFCKEDEALICLVCVQSKEHRNHETLPLDEASQEYKDKFCSSLEGLKEERERIVGCKADIEKESQDRLKQVTGEKQETVTKFKELHTFLEEQENRLVAQMEEVEKEVARKRDQQLTELSEALSSLDSLIQEMEEKCQQPDSELLQDAGSILQSICKKGIKNSNRSDYGGVKDNGNSGGLQAKVAPPWSVKACTCRSQRVCKSAVFAWVHISLEEKWPEGKICQLKIFLLFPHFPPTANVTLDADTAHPKLILSEDRKSLRAGEKAQTLPNNPERFGRYCAVLGCEGFTGGRHFWDVLVGSEGGWAVGVARKSVRRKGEFTFSPDEGIWVVGKWKGHCRASIEDDYAPLTLPGEPKRIRVCLNYDGGRVAFFDADRGALIYEYSGASFSGETLLPYFEVDQKGHLKLSS
ncbi:E3 ubiquitin-protein ligase TRIM7-like [Sphaerodactylus townsendi]|uniref:E3 ubiquitin-protein ligase TRIM7-like n=1 Tax=Sphaerodactylus townsendi TaxID=933632 RepID=UPI002026A69B|nr:E3 ubiquitin-protein ligase TRIM7-like [Sphaerodactylus townsendi]